VNRGIAVAVDGTEPARRPRVCHRNGTGAAELTGVFVIDNGWADFIGNDWQSSRSQAGVSRLRTG
jgi:hypothetical protein